jgi:phosphatidylinositol alpha 1,6-mannosyltransferase
MPRGVDAELFHPGKRTRSAEDTRPFVLGLWDGFRWRRTCAAGPGAEGAWSRWGVSFRFLIVGHGGEAGLAAREICRARSLPGYCAARRSVEAYANMDLFVFPSHTDTFGNVVLEASGERCAGDCDARRRAEDDCARGSDGADCGGWSFAAAVAGVLDSTSRSKTFGEHFAEMRLGRGARSSCADHELGCGV